MKTSNRVVLTRIALACILSILAVSRARDASGQAPRAPQGSTNKYVLDEAMVRFVPGAAAAARAAAHAAVGATVLNRYATIAGLEHVKLPPGLSVQAAIELYQRNPIVLYAEPDFIVQTTVVPVVPNDPQFGSLWGLNNANDADIDAPEAWSITTGSSSVVVGVIDTGADYNHPDLAANMYLTGDCTINGVDDDGNGFIDDCHGIDFANNDSDPMDDNQHGTHVSGTIGAVGNNNIGVAGVNWNVKILPCKFLNAAGSGTTDGAVSCLNYMAIMKDRGVNLVASNNSWGGGGFSQALYDAIDAHRQRGILFIAAAGNATLDNDSAQFFPASYYLPNIISVAATTSVDGLAGFSNYGRRTVHLGAPGEGILSTTPNNTYGTLSGTSMATPHVTGVAALLKAQDVNRDWRAIRNLLLAGGDNKVAVTNTVTQKRLNAYGAMTCSNSTVLSRLRPISTVTTAAAGTTIDLAALNINCANPADNVTVTVNPGGTIVNLLDNGFQPDQAAGDGVYSAQWTPATEGTYTLTFTGGDVVTVYVLRPYTVAPTAFVYRTIGGTNLNLGDDSSAQINSPFPLLFGGGSFTALQVSSNGNVNVTAPFTAYTNVGLPTTLTSTLIAPFWDDLFGVGGTAQNVFWEVTGVTPSRELVVEWRDIRQFSCNTDSLATVKFQIVFFENRSDILFNYSDVLFGGACAFANQGASATVGVQIATTSANQKSFNTASLTDASALLWTIGPSPVLSVVQASQSFGNVNVGSSADRSFTVQNAGGGTLSGNATVPLGGFSISSGSPFNVAPGAPQDVVVRFTPTAAGPYSSNVSFTSNGGNASRPVDGTGVAVSPQLSVTPPSQDFGSVPVGSTADRNFTVQNTGGGTLTVTASTAVPFSVVSPASPFNVGAGGSQIVVTRFSPTVSGSFNGNVNFTSNGGNASPTVTGTSPVGQITVTSPNGGEVWTVGGKPRTITWTSSGITGNVMVHLSRDSGVNFTETVQASTPNNGKVNWKPTGSSTTARIRVCNLAGTVCDQSDNDFTIQ
jgi:hypothetical protein